MQPKKGKESQDSGLVRYGEPFSLNPPWDVLQDGLWAEERGGYPLILSPEEAAIEK